MAGKMEGLLLRLEREIIVARKELNNLRKEMNSTKKMFCKKFNDIQETVEKGYITESCGNSKKRKNVNDKRSTAKALDVGVTSDELCGSRTIGYVHSCFKEKNGIPRQSSVCLTAKATLKIEFPGFTNPEHSLEGLEQFSHIWIIFVFHKNTNKTVRAKVKPPRLDGAKVGVFSSRSPHRPNAIGLSLAKLDGIDGNVLYLSGIDILDGTPVLDVKPYIPLYDQPVAKETDTTESCSSDLMESGETVCAATRELQQTLIGNNSPGKSVTEATHIIQSRAESDTRPGFYCEQRFRENYSLEINSDVSMETDPEPEDNIENKTYRDETSKFLPVKSEYNPPFSACQHMVSLENVAMETTKDARFDTQTINVYSEEPTMSQEDTPSSGGSVCMSKKEKNTNRDSASECDQHLQEIDSLTCDMRVVKVESVSESYCLNPPKCLSERESPHEIAESPDRQTQPKTVPSLLPESRHDHTQQLQYDMLSHSSSSPPEVRSPSRKEPYGRVLTRVGMPPHNLFHQEELERDRSPTRQESQNSLKQTIADIRGRARMIWQPDLPSDGNDQQERGFNDRSSVQQTLQRHLTHRNCFHDPNSQGSRDLALDKEQQIERRPLYQTPHLVNRSPPNKSNSPPKKCLPQVFDCSGSMATSSHDQTALNRRSPHVTTRHSSSQARQTDSSPRHNSTGIAAQDQRCLTRPLVTVPDWIQQPPISKLNIIFSRLAEASLMLFHGKDDININVKQDICRKCIENEKPNKPCPSSPKSQCVYRLELISSRSSAKRAITDILKSDPRSVYRRNHCPDEPYCFSVDVLNLTCKFEQNTVMVVKIDPASLTREAQNKETTEDGDHLSSSAIQFDPSGHRILLGPHHVDAEVILKNLRDIYDKNQKKTLTGSEQRVANARIDMVATATAEIRRLKVYVQRCPESTRKTGDSIGAIELKVNCERHDMYRTHFYVDLDSVYKTENGEMVYWLDKVEVEERNKWELIIILEFVDGSFRHFQSKAFRIRTKPRTCKQVVLTPSTV